MKKLLIIISALFIGSNTVIPSNITPNEQYKVLKVIDGDTVYIDFNRNNTIEKDERVRLNGIDAFETRISPKLEWQKRNYNLTTQEALGLGYLGQKFAQKELLNKYVFAEYSADTQFDPNNRHLMSIYYNCNKQNKCKNYEAEILKKGLATVFIKSNLAKDLGQYENKRKIYKNAIKARKLKLKLIN